MLDGCGFRFKWVHSTRLLLDRYSTASRSHPDRFPIASRPLCFSTYNPKCLTCQTFCPSATERGRPPRPLTITHADRARPVPDRLDLYPSMLPDRTRPLPDRYSSLYSTSSRYQLDRTRSHTTTYKTILVG